MGWEIGKEAGEVEGSETEKASGPIWVPLFRVVMFVSRVQLRKAKYPIEVTGFPSMVAGMARSPLAFFAQFVIDTVSPVVS